MTDDQVALLAKGRLPGARGLRRVEVEAALVAMAREIQRWRSASGRGMHRGYPVTEPCSIPDCDGGCPSIGCDA